MSGEIDLNKMHFVTETVNLNDIQKTLHQHLKNCHYLPHVNRSLHEVA